MNISDVDEIYKIATYGKVNEERVSIIKEKQENIWLVQMTVR